MHWYAPGRQLLGLKGNRERKKHTQEKKWERNRTHIGAQGIHSEIQGTHMGKQCTQVGTHTTQGIVSDIIETLWHVFTDNSMSDTQTSGWFKYETINANNLFLITTSNTKFPWLFSFHLILAWINYG